MKLLIFQPHFLVIYLVSLQYKNTRIYDLSQILSKKKENYYYEEPTWNSNSEHMIKVVRYIPTDINRKQVCY